MFIMDKNEQFNESLNNDLKSTTNIGEQTANTGLNTAKTGFKIGAKAINSIDKEKAAKLATNKYFWIAILVVICIILLACLAHNASAIFTYTDKDLSADSESQETLAFFDTTDIFSFLNKLSLPFSDDLKTYFESFANIFTGSSVDSEKKQAYTNYVNELKDVLANSVYTGDSLVGKGSYVYQQAFQTTFDYIYTSLVRKTVVDIIEQRGYDRNKTLDSLNRAARPESNINYAEIIAVMSQGDFTLNNGSIGNLFDILKNENYIDKLYSITVQESPSVSSFYIGEETKEQYLVSLKLKDTTEVGTVVETKSFPLSEIANITHGLNIYDSTQVYTIYEYIRDKDIGSMEQTIAAAENGISSSIIKEGRSIIFPYKCIPKVEFTTYCSANEIEITEKKINAGFNTITIQDQKQIITYTTEAKITTIYGNITINPYTLTDLYAMFNVDPYSESVDFPTVKNYELLDSVEMGIRTFAPDINFGSSNRTPFNNSYSSYGLTDEELLKLLASLENSDLTVLQQSVFDLCVSCEGTPYSQPRRMSGPGKGFDCSSYTSWVYAQLGIYFSNGTYWGQDNVGHAPVAANICKYLEEKNCQISSADLQVGDLVFWNYSNKNVDRYKRIDHVAIYVGNGMIYEASGSAGKVRTREIYGSDKIVSYCRPSLLLQQ